MQQKLCSKSYAAKAMQQKQRQSTRQLQGVIFSKGMCILKLFNKSLFLASSLIMTSSCTVVAEREDPKTYNNCLLSNSSWTVKKESLLESKVCKNSHPACLPVLGVVVPAITTVVAGSIYIVGNTIHWLEYQGKCDSETIEVKTEELKQISKPG